MVDKYDAIIIGSGIGGSAVGALLAHAGWKILILDKNKWVGGRCTSYYQNGYTLDLGTHNIPLGHKGPLETVFRKIDMPNTIDWLPVGDASLQIGDKVMKYNRKAMIKVLQDNEQINLINIFTHALKLTEEELDKLWYVPLTEWVNRYTKDPLVHCIIESFNCQFFCIPSAVASTAEFIKCWKELVTVKATAYPKGGNIAIPEGYISAIKKYKGDVRLGTGVKRIIVKNGAAVGVRLEDDSEFLAPVIISNADIKTTVDQLVGAEHFPASYVQEVRNLTFSDCGIVLKIALKEKVTDVPLVVYIPDEYSPPFKLTEEMREGKVPEWVGAGIVIPSNIDPSLAPPGRQLISLVSACLPGQDWKQWKKVLFNNFYRVFPQAKGKVLKHWLETPDFYDARAGEGGKIIGVAQTVNQIHERRPSVQSPLSGLHLCSADVGKHGIGTELAANCALELFEILTSR